jgi:hypothetical protein
MEKSIGANKSKEKLRQCSNIGWKRDGIWYVTKRHGFAETEKEHWKEKQVH